MDGTECKKSEFQRLCCKNVPLRRYCSCALPSCIADEYRKIAKANYSTSLLKLLRVLGPLE